MILIVLMSSMLWASPTLDVERARAALYENRLDDAFRSINRAQSGPEQLLSPLYFEVCEAMGMRSLCEAEYERSDSPTKRALADLSAGRTNTRAVQPADDEAVLALSLAQLEAGRVEEAHRLAAELKEARRLSFELAMAVKERHAGRIKRWAMRALKAGHFQPLSLLALGDASPDLLPASLLAMVDDRLLALRSKPTLTQLYRGLYLAQRLHLPSSASALAVQLRRMGEVEVVGRAPLSAEALRSRALSLTRGQTDPAPSNPADRARLAAAAAQMLVDLGRTDEALTLLERARRSHDSVRLAELHTRVALQRGHTVVALDLVDQALALAALGDAADRAGLLGQATRDLSDLYALKGQIAASLDRLPVAVLAYATAVSLRPTASSYFQLGLLYGQLGQPVRAVVNFERALALGEDDGRTASRLAYWGGGEVEHIGPALNPANHGQSASAEVERAPTNGIPVLGEVPPDWTLPGVSDQQPGELLVFAFWATWCKPCRRELPLLNALSERWRSEGFNARVIMVNVDSDERDYLKWLRRGHASFPALELTWSPQLAVNWGISALPTTFLVGSDGILSYRHEGFAAGDEARLNSAARK